ncbi:MAG: hydrogenase formation protein HypD [Gammaproteobacteria bacterium]|nr:hydrogenase formation protein HypD [Gammaproteobacteria bacterium]
MRYIDEYRDADKVKQLAAAIKKITTREHRLMEVCGGQTHSIVKYGLDQIIPDQIELIHGPGCPVCVTPMEILDQAIALAARADVIFCSFGDMLRVPGSEKDLLSVKAEGGDVRIVYSPLDAVKLAKLHPDKQIVFLAVGFETTAPANALSVIQAEQLGLENYSLLISHVLVPPAIEALMTSSDCRVQGFLSAGHVCAVMGYEEYRPIVEKYKVPIVVTGFEPLDILQGIYLCVKQLEEGRAELENQYTRVVSEAGNRPAQEIIKKVFTVSARKWRGIGEIPNSGFGLSETYSQFDAAKRFDLSAVRTKEDNECISGLIMQGIKKPHECPAFGIRCTPEKPLGAPMVSSEGACSAYYRYRKS